MTVQHSFFFLKKIFCLNISFKFQNAFFAFPRCVPSSVSHVPSSITTIRIQFYFSTWLFLNFSCHSSYLKLTLLLKTIYILLLIIVNQSFLLAVLSALFMISYSFFSESAIRNVSSVYIGKMVPDNNKSQQIIKFSQDLLVAGTRLSRKVNIV